MTENPPKYTFDRVVRLTISVAVLIVVLLLLRFLSDVLIPFAAAVVLAYLINPMVTLLEHKIHRRGWAVALTLVGLGIVGTALVTVIVALSAAQVQKFGADISKLRQDLTASITAPASVPPPAVSQEDPEAEPPPKSATGFTELRAAWPEFIAGEGPRDQRFIALIDKLEGTYIGNAIDRFRDDIMAGKLDQLMADAAQRLLKGGWTVLSFSIGLLLGLTGLIIVLLYLVFLLMDFPEYSRTWSAFLPPTYREPIVEFLGEFNVVLRRYFRGQAVVASIVGILFATGFSIIGLPMAVPFGLFVGLLNMVPYLQTVAIVPGLLLALIRSLESGNSLSISVVLVLAVFAVVQLSQDALITPRVMGKATGLRPIAILLGIFIWGKLLGFLGLILAIPLTCLGIAYYRRFVLLHGPEATKVTPDPEPP